MTKHVRRSITQLTESDFPFYVYELLRPHKDGYVTAYIGKGSGKRLDYQKEKYRLDGWEICRFMDEVEAYRYERELIFRYWPPLNKKPSQDAGGTIKRRAAIALMKMGVVTPEIEAEAYGWNISQAPLSE